VQDLAARLAEMERQARIEEILSGPPGPRHAAPKHRDRPDWLRVIPGGLAALVPMPGHGVGGFLPAFGQVWLGRRAWPRWAVAAVALGLAMATEVPTAADVRDSPAVARAHRRAGEREAAAGPLMRHRRSADRHGPARLPWQPMAGAVRTLVP
jgi:hypothetical protein